MGWPGQWNNKDKRHNPPWDHPDWTEHLWFLHWALRECLWNVFFLVLSFDRSQLSVSFAQCTVQKYHNWVPSDIEELSFQQFNECISSTYWRRMHLFKLWQINLRWYIMGWRNVYNSSLLGITHSYEVLISQWHCFEFPVKTWGDVITSERQTLSEVIQKITILA